MPAVSKKLGPCSEPKSTIYWQAPRVRGKKEAFGKCSISFKFKEGENFNHRNTLSILRIKI